MTLVGIVEVRSENLVMNYIEEVRGKEATRVISSLFVGLFLFAHLDT